MNETLAELLLERSDLAALDPAARRLELRTWLAERGREHLLQPIVDHIDGAGPLSRLLEDEAVTDVLVNGPDEIWFERDGRLQRAPDISFSSEGELTEMVSRWIAASGGRVDRSHPIADGRLGDGSRIHVALPPVAPAGPLVSIRRLGRSMPSLSRLVELGLCSDRVAGELRDAVTSGAGIAIGGGTGSGKTTLLNALLSEVPHDRRVVTAEETPELHPDHPHLASLVVRAGDPEGLAEIGLRGLVRAGLRMRPDVLVIGEVRGGEAAQILGASAAGSCGTMVTVHARCLAGIPERLVSLALQAGTGASETTLRSQIEAAFEVLVHLAKTPGGRRVTELAAR